MKKINELQNHEILALTEDDLEQMVKQSMMEEGIPFLDKPKEPDYEKIPLPERILYSLPHLNLYSTDENVMVEISNIIENSRESLRRIESDYINNRFDYEVRKLKENSWDENDIKFKPSKKTVYSEDQALTLKEVNKRNKERQKKHEELLAEWEKIQERINKVRASIYEPYWKVREEDIAINEHKNRFVEYVQISNGDKKIALSFYKKAYTITDDIENELLK